jgi:hypothetical protein
VTRQHPDEPFVGWERLRAEDQPVRDLQRRIQDLEEENAIFKKLWARRHQRSEVNFRVIHDHRFACSVRTSYETGPEKSELGFAGNHP